MTPSELRLHNLQTDAAWSITVEHNVFEVSTCGPHIMN